MSLTNYVENDYVFSSLISEAINPDVSFDLNVNINSLVPRKTFETDTSGKAFDYYIRLVLSNDYDGLRDHWIDGLEHRINNLSSTDDDRVYILEDYIIGLESYYDDADIYTKAFYLANSDTAYRSYTFTSFRQFMPDDIANDLSSLITHNQSIIDSFSHSNILHTPIFGINSPLSFNGADGDLIIDDVLFDCKSTFFSKYSPIKDLPQLLGYYFLSKFDDYNINGIGLILPRHKVVWSSSINNLFIKNGLLKAENYFFNKVKRVKVKGRYRTHRDLLYPIYN